MKKISQKTLAYLMLVLTCSIWGSMYVISKYALASIPPVTVLLFRYIVAVASLLPILKKNGVKPIRKGDMKYFILIGAFGYFFSVSCQLTGTKLLDSSMSSLMNALNPVIILLLATIFLKEKLTLRRIISISLSLTGVFIIIGVKSGRPDTLGFIMACLSVLFWSGASILIRKISPNYSAVQVSVYGISIAIVFTFIASMIELRSNECTLTVPAVLSVIYIGTACTAVAHTLWTKCLSVLDAGTCSMMYPMQPLTSAVLGFFMLHEKLTVNFVAGCILISLGIITAFVQLPKKNRKEEN